MFGSPRAKRGIEIPKGRVPLAGCRGSALAGVWGKAPLSARSAANSASEALKGLGKTRVFPILKILA